LPRTSKSSTPSAWPSTGSLIAETVRHADHSLLCWFRSQHHGKACKTPFELSGREATKKRYRMLWKRIVFFCIRAHLFQAQDRHRDILSLPFSSDAWLPIRNAWTAIPATPDQRVTNPVMRACDDTNDGDNDCMDDDVTDSEGSEDEYCESECKGSM
jgi:hypothetical protein